MPSTVQDTLQGRLQARLEEAPERRALGFVGRQGDVEWLTRTQVWEEAATLAPALVERGLGPGDVCVLALPSEQFCCKVLLAVLLVGGVPVLVAPPVVRGLHSNLRQVLAHLVGKTRAPVAVVAEEDRALARELRQQHSGTRFLCGEAALGEGAHLGARPDFARGVDIAALQLTSGTTAFPRICVWRHSQVLAALDGMTGAMGLGQEDLCVNWTPLYHDMGLVNNLFLCLCQGVPLVMLPTTQFLRKPGLWLQVLSATGATLTWSPNFGFAIAAQRVRDRDLEGVRLDQVRAFWNAAERIHLETVLAFQQRFAPYGVAMEALKTNFGCAENVGGATFSDPQGAFAVEHLDGRRLHEEGLAVPAAAGAETEGAISVVGVGRPCADMSIEILAPDGESLADGQVGEIALTTASRMSGYLDDPEATAEALRGERLLTGDLGYLRERELFWVGRSRERINLHGKKYDPSDFEGPLLGVAGLREGCFAAFGIDDPRLGTQLLVLVAEVRDSTARPVAEIIDEIRERALLEVGAPVSEILLVPQGTLSKTSSGKRRHRFYRELYQQGALGPLSLSA